MDRKNLILRMIAVCLVLIVFFPFTILCEAKEDKEEETKKTVRVGYFYSPNFQDMDKDGSNKGGYGYEYLQKIACYTGWEYEYVYGEWTELLDKLKNGEIDIMGDVTYMPDRDENMLFSIEVMGKERYYLFTYGPDSKIQADDIDSLNGAKIGVRRDSSQQLLLETWLEEHQIACEIVTYESEEERRNDLKKGIIDGSMAIDMAIDMAIYDEWVPAYILGASEYYFAVNKEREDLLEELADAMEKILTINPYYAGMLEYRYHTQNLLSTTLTEKEKKWCEEKGTLKVGILSDYFPYCGVNAKTGEIEGVCTLIARTAERKFGLRFDWVVFDTHDELLKALREETIDMAFPAEGELWLAEENGYSQSNAVVECPLMLVYHSDFAHGEVSKAAVATGGPIQEFYTQRYWPDAGIVYCDKLVDCARLLSEGKADAFIMNGNRMAKELQGSSYYRNLTFVNISDTWECCFAVKRGNTELLNIIDKNIALTGNTEIENAVIRFSQRENKYTLADFIRDNATAIVIGLVLLSIIIVIAFSIRMTKESKARKAAEDSLRLAVEARQAEEEARKEAERVNEISMNKSSFLANMSHELRTPINVILGMDEMILREGGGGETRARAMDIKSAAQILLSLINDILDFSKIESGQMRVIAGEYSLVSLIADLALLSETRARQKSLVFKMEIDPELPIGLYGDDVHLRQIFTNLLTNAIKYTPEGTVILRISEKRREGETIFLRCEVEDTGMGIKQEEIDKLFIPYSRVDEHRNRHVEGTGLGLPIIINLLKMMGSGLEVNSVYGQGSVFYFELEQKIVDKEPIGDIEKRMSDAVKDYEYRVSFVAPKARVLVVDDNSMNRDIFASLLKETKVQVTAASSGQKCLDLVQDEHFDLIFMDHLMPEMDGVETLGRLKQLEKNKCKDTPVIALTANAFSGDRERYIALGFDDFLSKPIISEKLEALIRKKLPAEYVEDAPEKARDSSGESAQPVDDLPEIEGVDWDYAALRIHDHAILLRSLKKFYEDIPGEQKAISDMAGKLQTEKGRNDYRIRVHSIKSTAAQLGILSVSTLAKILEFAARDGEIDKIQAVHPVLLEELSKNRDLIAPFMEQDTKRTPADLSELSGFLDMLQFYMSQMDIGQAFSAMEQIKAYSYAPEMQEGIDRLSEKVSALEFEEASEIIGQLAEQLDAGEDG